MAAPWTTIGAVKGKSVPREDHFANRRTKPAAHGLLPDGQLLVVPTDVLAKGAKRPRELDRPRGLRQTGPYLPHAFVLQHSAKDVQRQGQHGAASRMALRILFASSSPPHPTPKPVRLVEGETGTQGACYGSR
jgi:hypothetical protein